MGLGLGLGLVPARSRAPSSGRPNWSKGSEAISAYSSAASQPSASMATTTEPAETPARVVMRSYLGLGVGLGLVLVLGFGFGFVLGLP